MMQEIKVPCIEENVDKVLKDIVELFNSNEVHPYDAFTALERMLGHVLSEMIRNGLVSPDVKVPTKPTLTLVKNDEIV